MEILIGILIIIVLAGFTFFYFALPGRKSEDNQPLLMIQNQVQEIVRTLDRRMGESHESMQKQFHESARIIQNVTERLTKLDETNRQVMGFTEQLQGLQDILRNPKQRGVLGEYYLETVLKNVLPPGSYQMQYSFADGSIVDAVVFVKDKVIPIDSKFSLENYERILATRDAAERERMEKLFKQDLKTRIDETSKYIKPGENTMDFAFMFIPSEAIYYDLLINKIGAVQVSTQDLIEYAFKDRHVIIVSPTSFLAYLQTVLQGLRALQIEESAKEIRKNVEALKKHMVNYDNYVQKMGSQLGTLVNTYNTGYRELKKIDKDVFRITGAEESVEPLVIEKPAVEEE
jgi:DNA recombination protein RmuC